jgi:hypothetical protein
VLYVLGLVVITAAIAGVLPALHATRRGSGGDLRQLGGSTGIRLGRMWNALIIVQALSLGRTVQFPAFLPARHSGLTNDR